MTPTQCGDGVCPHFVITSLWITLVPPDLLSYGRPPSNLQADVVRRSDSNAGSARLPDGERPGPERGGGSPLDGFGYVAC